MAEPAIHLLVNPVAGGGAAARVVSRAVSALSNAGKVAVHQTRHAGDEHRIAILAARQQADALVVLGGDGTLSQAARGILDAGATHLPLALLAAGTGNDFAKAIGAPVNDFDATASLIAQRCYRAIDVGMIGNTPFLNSAGLGFDAEVLSAMGTGATRGGRATYARSALHQLFRYRGFGARMHADVSFDRRWLTMVFANGPFFGGMFKIAPGASIDDGMIDFVGVHDVGPLARVALFARAMRGAHVHHANVTMARRTTFELEFDSPPLLQADGELLGTAPLSVRVSVKRKALRIAAHC